MKLKEGFSSPIATVRERNDRLIRKKIERLERERDARITNELFESYRQDKNIAQKKKKWYIPW